MKKSNTPWCEDWEYRNKPVNLIEPFLSISEGIEKALVLARDLERELNQVNAREDPVPAEPISIESEAKVSNFFKSRREKNTWHTVYEVAVATGLTSEEVKEICAKVYFSGVLESMVDSAHGFGQKYRWSQW